MRDESYDPDIAYPPAEAASDLFDEYGDYNVALEVMEREAATDEWPLDYLTDVRTAMKEAFDET